MRAGVGSLREIANLSARAAVAKHTTKKLRRSFAVTLPLTIVAFVLAGTIYLLASYKSRFHSLTFGAMMVGLISAVELGRSWWKLKRAESKGNLATSTVKSEPAGVAPQNGNDDRVLSPGTSQLLESVLDEVDVKPVDSASV
jgi:hypothetical protein